MLHVYKLSYILYYFLIFSSFFKNENHGFCKTINQGRHFIFQDFDDISVIVTIFFGIYQNLKSQIDFIYLLDEKFFLLKITIDIYQINDKTMNDHKFGTSILKYLLYISS